jgi:hypothetical protein
MRCKLWYQTLKGTTMKQSASAEAMLAGEAGPARRWAIDTSTARTCDGDDGVAQPEIAATPNAINNTARHFIKTSVEFQQHISG